MIIAIDFGTSNTVICIQDPITLEPRTLKFNQISRQFETISGQVSVIPSLVFVQKNHQLLFGEEVRSQRVGFAQPERLFQAFKRDLVANYRPPARQLDGQNYTAELVCELFIQQIWQQLSVMNLHPQRVVFTVPIGAFELYLDWFRDLAEKLGLPAIQLVDESTAAALGYAIQHPGSTILVVDFGGGTLDLSLIRTNTTTTGNQKVKAEVLAKSDAYIGGVDIDAWIVEHYLRQINSSREEVKEIGWQNLLGIAEQLKIKLSTSTIAKESWFDDENFISHELQLSQVDLAEILEERQLLEQLRQALDEVLTTALSKGINKANIEQVLLVGGSCQIPAVQQLIISYFGKQKVKLDKPFEAVVHGALVLGQLVEIEDYLRHGYAIRLWEPHAREYTFFPLFEKGKQYPCQQAEPLTLQVAVSGQRELKLDIGEVADVSQAEVSYDAQGKMTSSQLNKQAYFRSLSGGQNQVCVAHLEPTGEPGVDRVEVFFEVNEQRVLLATVKDLLTGKLLGERQAIAKLQ